VSVTDRVPRCVMVTRAQPGGIDVDRDVLRWVHREHGGLLAVGASVVQPGRVRVGDEVRPTPGTWVLRRFGRGIQVAGPVGGRTDVRP